MGIDHTNFRAAARAANRWAEMTGDELDCNCPVCSGGRTLAALMAGDYTVTTGQGVLAFADDFPNKLRDTYLPETARLLPDADNRKEVDTLIGGVFAAILTDLPTYRDVCAHNRALARGPLAEGESLPGDAAATARGLRLAAKQASLAQGKNIGSDAGRNFVAVRRVIEDGAPESLVHQTLDALTKQIRQRIGDACALVAGQLSAAAGIDGKWSDYPIYKTLLSCVEDVYLATMSAYAADAKAPGKAEAQTDGLRRSRIN